MIRFDYFSIATSVNHTKIVAFGGKEMVFNVSPSYIEHGIDLYRKGEHVQQAFQLLSVNEREFLTSGLLPHEFDELFMIGSSGLGDEE